MYYTPLNYEGLNNLAGHTSPANVKSYNNKTFAFWQRSLFQRACSVFEWQLPEEWNGARKDFFLYCLYRFGFVCISEDAKRGQWFQPCTLYGYDFYYQPTNALIANPSLPSSLDLKIGKECEILKLTPDYQSVFDIIDYHAEKLSSIDNGINQAIINTKLAWILAGRNKATVEMLKRVFDRIQKGEPAVFLDKGIGNDPTDKDVPWQFLDFGNIKEKYILSDLLIDFQTILNNFDAEIGIPTVPYQKKERMVQSEADSRQIDSASRSTTWLECLKGSIENVKTLYPGITLGVELRYKDEGGADNGENNTVRNEQVSSNTKQ